MIKIKWNLISTADLMMFLQSITIHHFHHSSEESEGVFGTAISFTKMSEEVVFEAGNPEKNARLFFTLAAKNSEEHVENISKLSEMLMTDGLIEALMDVNTIEEYQQVMN